MSSLPLPVAVSARRVRRLDSNIVMLMDRWATDDSAHSVEFIAPESEPINTPVHQHPVTKPQRVCERSTDGTVND